MLLLKKFKGLKDEELLPLYNKGDDDAEYELYRRYRAKSFRVINEFLDSHPTFKDVCEWQDLLSICLLAFDKAAKKFEGAGNLYTYWRTIAERDLSVYIQDYYLDSDICLFSSSHSDYYGDSFSRNLETTSNEIRYDTLVEDVRKILYDEKNGLTSVDRDMFYMYVYGYSLKEISDKTGHKYSSVRLKINHIKALLEDILFNS